MSRGPASICPRERTRGALIAGALAAGALLTAAVPLRATAQTPQAAVLTELNFARAHPDLYAERLRLYRQSFNGRLVREAGDDVDTETVEGVAAVDEAIAFLRRQAPLPPLDADEALRLAAADFAERQGADGEIGHVGPDGSTLSRRIERRAAWRSLVAEDISYGEARAEAVVRQLIVDDGVPDRGHRTNIFDPRLRVAGVGCGPHRVYGAVCVIDFADGVGPLARND